MMSLHTISLDSDGGDVGPLLGGRGGCSSGGRKDGGNGKGLHDGRVGVDDNYS